MVVRRMMNRTSVIKVYLIGTKNMPIDSNIYPYVEHQANFDVSLSNPTQPAGSVTLESNTTTRVAFPVLMFGVGGVESGYEL